MDSFKKAYRKSCESIGGVTGAGHGKEYVEKVQNEINETVKKMEELGSYKKAIGYSKGDIAEPWHSGTLKVDATAKGLSPNISDIPRDRSPIDVKSEIGAEKADSQVKYWGSAEKTAKQISRPDYEGLQKVVPEDQLQGVKDKAYREAIRNSESRPDQARNYQDTYEKADDKISLGGAESKPKSEPEMREIARKIKSSEEFSREHGLSTEEFVKWKNVAEQSVDAAANAAIISAILSASPHIIKIVKDLVVEQKLNRKDIQKALLDVKDNALKSGLRGAIAGFITTSAKSGLLGESMKFVSADIIATATVVGMNAISRSFLLYEGKISEGEFAEACLRDSFILGSGVFCSGIGQALIPIPILGSVVGNIVGVMLGSIVYDGGKQLFFSFFIETGFTFFGLVDQNYKNDESILKRCGFDLLEISKVELDHVSLDSVALDLMEVELMEIKIVRRGMIGVSTIGYIF